VGDAITVGQRVRKLRTERGLSLARLAALSGLDKGYLSKVENGLRSLDQRRSMHAVADALRVPIGTLTGQPYDPATRHEETVRTAMVDISDALQGVDLDEPAGAPVRDLADLERATARVQQQSRDGEFELLAPAVPDLVTDLHAHAAGGDRATRQRALWSLVLLLNETWWVAKCAGQYDLSWLVADRSAAVARAHGAPEVVGLGEFIRVQSLARAGERARVRAGRLAVRAADDLGPSVRDTGPEAEVYGALVMSAAWCDVLGGRRDDAEVKLADAAGLAERTGNGTFGQLWFGPNEMGILRAAVAVEVGEGGAVEEAARGAVPETMPSRGRQADLFIQIGRGLAQEPRHAGRAVAMLRRAERLAPMRTRMDPLVRQTVGRLIYDAGGPDLRSMAQRMGLVPG